MKRENVEAIIFEHLQIQISSFWSKEGFVPILHMWHSRSWHEQYNLSMMIHRIYLTHSGRDVFLDWEELGGSKEKGEVSKRIEHIFTGRNFPQLQSDHILYIYSLPTHYAKVMLHLEWCIRSHSMERWIMQSRKSLSLGAFLDISFFLPMYSRLWNVSSLTWPSLPREFYLKPEKNVHVSVDQIKT